MLTKSLRDLCGIERMRRQRGDEAYNNADTFNFSVYSLLTSLDYIILNILDPMDSKSLFEAIEEHGFICSSDFKLSKGNYERIRKYKYSDLTVEFLYGLKVKKSILPPMRMNLRHPNQKLIRIVADIIQKYRIEQNTSVIEVTCDFYGKNLHNLMDFFHSHLFIRHQKSRPAYFKTTSYPEDCRSSHKGMRLYGKKDDGGGKRFLRVWSEPLAWHRSGPNN